MRGFLLITVTVVTLLVGGVLLNWFQQSIRQRFQSQAFLETQMLFQDLNGAMLQAITHLRKLPPNQLCNPLTLEGNVFADGFEDWSASTECEEKDLLVILRSSRDPGGVRFQVLLRNVDNASENNYLSPDGVLILED